MMCWPLKADQGHQSCQLAPAYHVKRCEEVIVVSHEVHLAHRGQGLLLRQAVGAGGQSQPLATDADGAAAEAWTVRAASLHTASPYIPTPEKVQGQKFDV
jgi:hypothetical protein